MTPAWSTDDAIAGLPLFSAAAASQQARLFHERDEAQANVLAVLRTGKRYTKIDYERSFEDGRRLAPAVEQLRNAHGFTIRGDGSAKKPYFMPDEKQRPLMARVTPEMKAAYYKLDHWMKRKYARQDRDGGACVLCLSSDDLRCHHVSYGRLFNEPLEDLLTLCAECHDRVHEKCGLKFPSGVSVQYAHWLGWKGFEAWLLP